MIDLRYTQNFNMKAPEGEDPVDITDITDVFDILDGELAKKANSSGGDISGTTIKTVENITASFPIPEAGESTKTFLSKIRKFMEDVNAGRNVTPVTLTAAGWTGSAAPYVQTVTVSGATANTDTMVVSVLAEGATEAVQKAYNKAYGIIVSGTASLGTGNATFRVYKKPAVDITIGLKGV
jgi:hypothetical protein